MSMKQRIKRIVEKIKERAKKISQWRKSEDGRDTVKHVAVVSGAAFVALLGLALFVVKTRRKADLEKIEREEWRVDREATVKDMRENVENARAWLNMMRDFWMKHPEWHAEFIRFAKKWHDEHQSDALS